MPGGDVGRDRELELAQPAPLPPLAQLLADAASVGWVLVSTAALLSGWFPFTTAGTVLAVGQAVAVAAVAGLQAVGVRRLTA